MGARGPKRGSASAAAAGRKAAAARAKPSQGKADVSALPAAHRENPEKLSGQALKDLGHRRGLPRSAMDTMSDAKIREQLRYLAYSQYEQPEVA